MSDGGPVKVGLVGAGPWARFAHAPVLAGGPETELSGIWARRPEAAAELASSYGAKVFEDVDEMIDVVDAVAFCVPPDVQARIGAGAARRGKALLLEKPIGLSLEEAEALAEAASSVPTMVVLSWRYADPVRAFLENARSAQRFGGRGWFINGGMLDGPFRTPWRLERGPLLDLGPHVLDLMDAALGRITSVHARGDLLGWVGLGLEHEGGAVSEVSLCFTTNITGTRSGAEVYGPDGVVEIDCAASVKPDAFATLRSEFAECVRTGRSHDLDVARGLHLQRVISDAERQLKG